MMGVIELNRGVSREASAGQINETSQSRARLLRPFVFPMFRLRESALSPAPEAWE